MRIGFPSKDDSDLLASSSPKKSSVPNDAQGFRFRGMVDYFHNHQSMCDSALGRIDKTSDKNNDRGGQSEDGFDQSTLGPAAVAIAQAANSLAGVNGTWSRSTK